MRKHRGARLRLGVLHDQTQWLTTPNAGNTDLVTRADVGKSSVSVFRLLLSSSGMESSLTHPRPWRPDPLQQLRGGTPPYVNLARHARSD